MNMLTSFEIYLRGRGLLPGTVGAYAGHLLRFSDWLEGTYGSPDLAAVTSLDIADYRRHLQNRGLKPATVNNALGAFYSWAAKEGLVQSDPTEGIKRLPEQKGSPRWLGRRKLGALARAVQKYGSKRNQALILLLGEVHQAGETGLRDGGGVDCVELISFCPRPAYGPCPRQAVCPNPLSSCPTSYSEGL